MARPIASRLLSPAARACAMESSRSGPSCAYRSTHSSVNVACDNHAADENHGLPSDPAPSRLPPRERGSPGSAPTSARSFASAEVHPATASSSGGGAAWRGGALAQRLAAARERRRDHGTMRGGEDRRNLELEREVGMNGIERRRRAVENVDRLREALRAGERMREHERRVGGRRSVRRDASRPPASAPPSRRGRRSPRPFRGRAANRSAARAPAARTRTRRRKVASASGAPRFPALHAASTSRSTTHSSPAGSLTSRCWATRSSEPGSSASSRAAARWPRARSAPESSA